MHIAFILSDLKGGGAQRMVINLANWMVSNGHLVDIVMFNSIGTYRDLISPDITIYDLEKPRSIYATVALARYIKNKKPNIIFSALYHVNIIAVVSHFLSCCKSTKLVISERNYVTQYLGAFSPAQRMLWTLLIKNLYGFSDHIIGISNGVCDDLKNILPKGVHERIETIYNPVVTDDFVESFSKNVPNIFPEGCSTKIITSGRIVLQKDYPTLLYSFSSYLKGDPKAHLVILGTGVLEPEMRKISDELDILDHVTFTGFVSEPLAYLKQADIFVITSAWEGFCNVIVEALYCGLSVVSTDCPSGPAEILRDGKYGLLCPVGDVDGVVQSLETCMSKPFPSDEQHKRALSFHVNLIGHKFLGRFTTLIEG